MNESVSIIYSQETGQILKMKSSSYTAGQELGKKAHIFGTDSLGGIIFKYIKKVNIWYIMTSAEEALNLLEEISLKWKRSIFSRGPFEWQEAIKAVFSFLTMVYAFRIALP